MLVRSGYSSIYNRKPSLPCFQWRATTISATHCRHRDLSFAALSLAVFKLQSRWITTKHSAQKIHFQGVFITITARFFSVCPSFRRILFHSPTPSIAPPLHPSPFLHALRCFSPQLPPGGCPFSSCHVSCSILLTTCKAAATCANRRCHWPA